MNDHIERIKEAAADLASAADVYHEKYAALAELLAEGGAVAKPKRLLKAVPTADQTPRKKPGPKPAKKVVVKEAGDDDAKTETERKPRTLDGPEKVLEILADGGMWFPDLLKKTALSPSGLYGILAKIKNLKRVIQTPDSQWRLA